MAALTDALAATQSTITERTDELEGAISNAEDLVVHAQAIVQCIQEIRLKFDHLKEVTEEL